MRFSPTLRYTSTRTAPIAQRIRASASGAEGRGFEPPWAHQKSTRPQPRGLFHLRQDGLGSNPRGRERKADARASAASGRARRKPGEQGRTREAGTRSPPGRTRNPQGPSQGAFFSFTAGSHGLEPERTRAHGRKVPKINDLIRKHQITQGKYRLKNRRIPPIRHPYPANLNQIAYFCEFVALTAVRAGRSHMYASWISDACRAPCLTGNVPHAQHSSPSPSASNDPLLQHCFLTRTQSLPVLTFANFCNPPI